MATGCGGSRWTGKPLQIGVDRAPGTTEAAQHLLGKRFARVMHRASRRIRSTYGCSGPDLGASPLPLLGPERTFGLAPAQSVMLLMGRVTATLGAPLMGERVERRLAAVLAADVAGYSRLMGADEEGTLAQLKAIRKAIVDPTIAAHRRRIVKTTGDGMLIEFASAVDAARGAAEIQRAMAKQNTNLPQDARIEFRIGIHVGDIIIDDSDIFGDGVNIAARL